MNIWTVLFVVALVVIAWLSILLHGALQRIRNREARLRSIAEDRDRYREDVMRFEQQRRGVGGFGGRPDIRVLPGGRTDGPGAA